MAVWTWISSILAILGQVAKVFPDWWKKHQSKKKASLEEEIQDLKLQRLALRKRLRDATMDEREEILKEYFALNRRILYFERLLRED